MSAFQSALSSPQETARTQSLSKLGFHIGTCLGLGVPVEMINDFVTTALANYPPSQRMPARAFAGADAEHVAGDGASDCAPSFGRLLKSGTAPAASTGVDGELGDEIIALGGGHTQDSIVVAQRREDDDVEEEKQLAGPAGGRADASSCRARTAAPGCGGRRSALSKGSRAAQKYAVRSPTKATAAVAREAPARASTTKAAPGVSRGKKATKTDAALNNVDAASSGDNAAADDDAAAAAITTLPVVVQRKSGGRPKRHVTHPPASPDAQHSARAPAAKRKASTGARAAPGAKRARASTDLAPSSPVAQPELAEEHLMAASLLAAIQQDE